MYLLSEAAPLPATLKESDTSRERLAVALLVAAKVRFSVRTKLKLDVPATLAVRVLESIL